MPTLLLPIATRAEARRLAEQVVARHAGEAIRVLLLNVQPPLPRHVAQFFSADDVHAYHQEAGMAILAPAIAVLDAAGIAHDATVRVGHAARTIVGVAEAEHCADVVLPEPARGLASLLRAGSVGRQVRHLLESRAA
ncbi:MAG: universal stress protein [Proteobacteria bacterium]|nr:universal stress protein [Pseudomonadota bacterium]